MNRLSPLIVRRVGRFAPPLYFEVPCFSEAAISSGLESLKLFAVGWLGGLVFFGTYIS
jgi:hypothetical protein